jgi:acetoin utilization protein AcuB
MFSIYGISGQTFRGALEQMPLVGAVRPSLHTRGINREGEGGLVNAITSGHLQAATPRNHEQVVAAYRRMLPRDLERGPLYHARQVMHTPVITARDDDPVELVWQLLIKHNIRQVPILDSTHRLVGLVHDRDLLTALNVDHDQNRI